MLRSRFKGGVEFKARGLGFGFWCLGFRAQK